MLQQKRTGSNIFLGSLKGRATRLCRAESSAGPFLTRRPSTEEPHAPSLTFTTGTTMDLPWYPQIAVDTAAGTVTGVGGGPYYNLVARHSGRCVDVSDNSAADGAVVLQWDCGTGLNQQWRLSDAGGGYVQVIAEHSGKCMDVSGASTADGADVNQYRCNGGTNQQWLLQDQGNGYYHLVARHSGKCLDVKDGSTANGTRLIQWPCGTGGNQQFQKRNA